MHPCDWLCTTLLPLPFILWSAHWHRWSCDWPVSHQTAMFDAPPLPPRRPTGVHSSSLAAAGGETSWAHPGCRWVEGYAAWSPSCSRPLPPLWLLSSAGVWVAAGEAPSAGWMARSEWSLSRWTARCCQHPFFYPTKLPQTLGSAGLP